MLEILGAIASFRVVASRATENGRAGSWGILGLAGWFGGEVLGYIIGSVVADNIFALLGIVYVVAIAGAVAAYVVIGLIGPAPGYASVSGEEVAVMGAATSGTPLDGLGPAPAAPQPEAPARRAGYCMDCGTNVWITESGSCPKGHGPQSIERLYSPGSEPEGMS